MAEPGSLEHTNGGSPADRARAAATADVHAPRREYLLAPPARAAAKLIPLLRDCRDAPVLWLVLNIGCTSAPCAAALYIWGVRSHVAGAAYLAMTFGLYLQRFLLAMHVTEHRPLFHSPAFNWCVSLLLAPLFGLPSGLYNLHHVLMHHVEGNNSSWDLSSTEHYQRDNFFHFLRYWLRHGILVWVELPLYALQKQWGGAACRCLMAESAYCAAMLALWRLNSVATTWVFLVPFVVTSFALMFGNWSQHIFIDARQPRNSYSMTYNCINAADNQKTFNDGYHIQHHLNSKLHWTQLPEKFLETLPNHSEHQALVFEGVGWFDVGMAVFCRRYDALLQWLVAYDERTAAMSSTQRIAMLRSRLRPIARTVCY